MMGELVNKNDVVVEINENGKTKELGKIIGLKGTTKILGVLDEKPRLYKEIDSIIGLSHATFIRRLNMLQILNLVKKKPITLKRRETHVYELTLRGIELMKFIDSYEKEVSLPLLQQKIIEIEK